MTARLALIGLLGLFGCQQDQSGELLALRAELETMRTSLAATDAALAAQSRVIESQSTLHTSANRKAAVLDPSEDGYSSMETTIGALLISLDGIEAKADGSQVAMRIGNPYAVSLQGITLRVNYGPRKREEQSYSDWSDSIRVKDVSIAEPIFSGSWNRVSFALPIKPDQLGHLVVAGDVDRLSLDPR